MRFFYLLWGKLEWGGCRHILIKTKEKDVVLNNADTGEPVCIINIALSSLGESK
jgi:hypothetical protein